MSENSPMALSSSLTRRSVIAAPVALALGGRPARAQAPRPNIVFIMADDLGYADVSCYGRRDYSTPAIDSLAQERLRSLLGLPQWSR